MQDSVDRRLERQQQTIDDVQRSIEHLRREQREFSATVLQHLKALGPGAAGSASSNGLVAAGFETSDVPSIPPHGAAAKSNVSFQEPSPQSHVQRHDSEGKAAESGGVGGSIEDQEDSTWHIHDPHDSEKELQKKEELVGKSTVTMILEDTRELDSLLGELRGDNMRESDLRQMRKEDAQRRREDRLAGITPGQRAGRTPQALRRVSMAVGSMLGGTGSIISRDVQDGSTHKFSLGKSRRCVAPRCSSALGTCFDRWFPVIHPQKRWRNSWNAFIMLLVILCALSVPVQVAFELSTMSPGLYDTLIITDVVVDCFFFLDILINFRTGYIERGLFVKDSWLACRRYLNSTFALDFITTFPLHYLLATSDSDAGRFNRLLRMVRLAKLGRMLKLSQYARTLADAFNFNPGVMRLFGSLLGTLLVTHWIACVFYVTTYHQLRFVGETDAVVRPLEADANAALDEILSYPLNLIQGPEGQVQFGPCYAISFFWAASILTGWMPFNIEPTDISLVAFTVTMLMIGLMLNAVIISSATSAVQSVDSFSHYQKQRLDRVAQYLHFVGVENKLRTRVLEYFRYMLSASTTYDDFQSIGRDLPPQLSAQLLVELHRDMLRQCKLFRTLDNVAVLHVLRKMMPCTFLPNHAVLRREHPCRAVYFILRGLVRSEGAHLADVAGSAASVVVGGRKKAGFSRITLHDHDFFGDLRDDDGNSLVSVTTLTYCNVTVMGHDELDRARSASMQARALKRPGSDDDEPNGDSFLSDADRETLKDFDLTLSPSAGPSPKTKRSQKSCFAPVISTPFGAFGSRTASTEYGMTTPSPTQSTHNGTMSSMEA